MKFVYWVAAGVFALGVFVGLLLTFGWSQPKNSSIAFQVGDKIISCAEWRYSEGCGFSSSSCSDSASYNCQRHVIIKLSDSTP